jgi:mannose-6-phosphate isomerase
MINVKSWPQVLCSSLTYKQGMPHMLKGEPLSRGIALYQPPFEEFQVLRVDVERPGTINLPAQKSSMMLLGLESTGQHSLQVCITLN